MGLGLKNWSMLRIRNGWLSQPFRGRSRPRRSQAFIEGLTRQLFATSPDFTLAGIGFQCFELMSDATIS